MDATLQITSHKQDVKTVNKDTVIEQQDDGSATGFEMPSIPVVGQEALLSGLLVGVGQLKEVTPENALLLTGMEVPTEGGPTEGGPPKSIEQMVEELSSASKRKLSASLIMPSSQQSTDVNPAVSASLLDGVSIDGEIEPLNTELAKKTLINGANEVAQSVMPSAQNSELINTPLTGLSESKNSIRKPDTITPPAQTPELISASLGELSRKTNLSQKTNEILPSLQKVGSTSVALNDLQVTNGTVLDANVPSAKALEWAKIDLTSTINNQHDKSMVSSKIGEKLNAILKDKINIQALNGIKTAQIKLDPPDMGHIRLTVSTEGDRVSVNISAQNAMVREGLIQTSERLHNNLVNENFINVSIDIDSENAGEKGANKEQDQEKIANNFFVGKDTQEKSQDEFIVKI